MRQQRQQKEGELGALQATSIETLWERDLNRFLESYEVRCGPSLPWALPNRKSLYLDEADIVLTQVQRHTRSSGAEHEKQRVKQQVHNLIPPQSHRSNSIPADTVAARTQPANKSQVPSARSAEVAASTAARAVGGNADGTRHSPSAQGTQASLTLC